MAPRDQHPLVIALVDAWARRAGYDPDDVWRWLRREATPPGRFVEGAVEAFWPRVRPEDFEPLPSHQNTATFGATMEAQTVRTGRRGRPATAHAFTRALKKKGLTVTEWAADKGLDRMQVKGWYTTGDGARRIPREWADAIEKELGVPARARSWPNGIRE